VATEFGIIGTSIWQQNMALLERLTVSRESKLEKLAELKKALHLDELVYLSTCNRVEFIYVSSGEFSGDDLLHRLVDYFFRDGRQISFFPNDFYHYTDKEAITHMFRTVSSLESLVVGETQITGQFKTSCQEAAEAGLAGDGILKVAEEALAVAKKVKRETGLGNGSVSMASLAGNEIAAHLKGIDKPLIALVGAGEMSVKLARIITKNNLGNMLFVNRTIEKAQGLADEFGGEVMALTDFQQAPPAVAAIVTATACPEAILDKDFVSKLPTDDRQVLCIDLAIPRDFALEVAYESGVVLLDIPHLKQKGNGNLRKKFVEVSKANQIVKEAVHKFLSDRIKLSLKPIFENSFNESLELAQRALNDLFAKRVTSLDAEDQEAVSQLVKKLIGHSAFQPAKSLSEHLAQEHTKLNLTSLRHEAI